jgi:transposase
VARRHPALVKFDSIDTEAPAVLLMKLKGIGPEFATVLWLEGLFGSFANRRLVAAC